MNTKRKLKMTLMCGTIGVIAPLITTVTLEYNSAKEENGALNGIKNQNLSVVPSAQYNNYAVPLNYEEGYREGFSFKFKKEDLGPLNDKLLEQNIIGPHSNNTNYAYFTIRDSKGYRIHKGPWKKVYINDTDSHRIVDLDFTLQDIDSKISVFQNDEAVYLYQGLYDDGYFETSPRIKLFDTSFILDTLPMAKKLTGIKLKLRFYEHDDTGWADIHLSDFEIRDLTIDFAM
ncbi:MAG: hypothetical protein HRT99_04265 [Mycoplasmatales bacterium]|nr:hypothetical protein [Mycoplasmatales bacterium]